MIIRCVFVPPTETRGMTFPIERAYVSLQEAAVFFQITGQVYCRHYAGSELLHVGADLPEPHHTHRDTACRSLAARSPAPFKGLRVCSIFTASFLTCVPVKVSVSSHAPWLALEAFTVRYEESTEGNHFCSRATNGESAETD